MAAFLFTRVDAALWRMDALTFEAGLFDFAEGTSSLYSSKLTGYSFSLLMGRGGIATFFLITLAYSKNLTSS